MRVFTILSSILLAALPVFSSPLIERALGYGSLPTSVCKEVVAIVDVLKLYKATPFCSSFLHISTSTATAVITSTTTSTVTTGIPATTTVFLPGDPPATNVRREANLKAEQLNTAHAELNNRDVTLPYYVSTYATTAVSKACSCLTLPTPSTTTTSTTTSTILTTIPAPTSTKTVYPCAAALPSPGPAYGDAPSPLPPSIPSTQNSLFGLSTPQGASAQACCHACFFEVPNCVQAYWYFYEGCVVQQGVGIRGTGEGVGDSCPAGRIDGLVYGPDVAPAFRSTGNFVGACGVGYDNF